MAVPDGIDTVTRYNATARAFHAVIAILVIVNLALGLVGEALEKTIDLFPLHKSIGLTVLALTLARIALRFTWKKPEYIPSLKRVDLIVAKTMHAIFYGLLLILPLTGWIMTSAFFTRQDYEDALDALSAGAAEPRLLVTDTIGLDATPVTFEALKRRTHQCKVLIAP